MEVQNGSITKNGVLPVTALIFFENILSVEEPIRKSRFDVPTTKMSIFTLFTSAAVLFGGAFSL